MSESVRPIRQIINYRLQEISLRQVLWRNEIEWLLEQVLQRWDITLQHQIILPRWEMIRMLICDDLRQQWDFVPMLMDNTQQRYDQMFMRVEDIQWLYDHGIHMQTGGIQQRYEDFRQPIDIGRLP